MLSPASDLDSIEAPQALRAPRTTTVHGRALTDEYGWLRDKDDPRVRAYLEAENAYTRAVMQSTEAFQESLYQEMLARIKETDMGVPYRYDDFDYYSRTEAGKDYPIYCRRRRIESAPEEIILDMNTLAEGHEFFSLGAFSVSPDANLLAYSTDVTGFREFTLHVKDLRSGALLPERIEKTRSVAWANDSATLFYVKEDAAKRAWRLYRHRLGSDQDELVFEEATCASASACNVRAAAAGSFSARHSATTSEVRCIPADQPAAAPRLIAARVPEHEYDVDHRGELFYIVTNDRGRNFRLVTAPVIDPRPQNWAEVIPHRDDVMLEDIDLFSRHSVIHEREGGFPRLRVVNFETGESQPVEFPEPVYSVFGTGNAEFDTDTFRFAYESLVTPDSVFDYDMNDAEPQAAQAGGGAGRLRSCPLQLGAALCHRRGRHAAADLDGLPEGPAQVRASALTADRLRGLWVSRRTCISARPACRCSIVA